MLMPLFFITLAAATLAALVWSGVELFRGREDPLATRLEELQAHAMSTSARRTVRRRGGFFNSFLYLISLVPGGEGYLRDTEEQLVQGGLRQRWAIGAYALFQLIFLLAFAGAM